MQLPVTVHIHVFRNNITYHIRFFNYSCFTQIKQTCYYKNDGVVSAD